ncbi:MAG: hypothetical protein KAJ47_01335 [Candidatus Aenigmarchaeota archaeon]|nr:hypothetical protein [Candidatus Aenigmarchaeota archaeon]
MKNKNQIFIIPLIAFLLSTIFYIGFISSFNNFGLSNNRFINSQKMYDNISENTILFLGDSQIREDINCLIIDSEQTNCLNLGIAGILPIQIALEKNKIISAKPKTIIFGISPLFFNENINKNDDFLFFMDSNKILRDNLIINQLTDKEEKILNMDRKDWILYKRKFLLPFYINFLKRSEPPKEIRYIENDFKNPYYFTEQKTQKELIEKTEDKTILNYFNMKNTSQRQWNSFSYLIEELNQAGIKVIILQMPLNPLLTEKLNRTSTSNYYHRLFDINGRHNITLIDLETEFSAEHFNDLTHLNNLGRDKLSKKISEGDYYII